MYKRLMINLLAKCLISFTLVAMFFPSLAVASCDISISGLFANMDIYNKKGGSAVYMVFHNVQGRYEASFNLYKITNCKEISHGTESSFAAVEQKLKAGGYENIHSLPSGEYKDVNGEVSFSYEISVEDGEVIVEQNQLNGTLFELAKTAIENPNSIWLEGSSSYRSSIVFKSPTFWDRLKDNHRLKKEKDYYIHRWTLNKNDTADLESFLRYSDIPDWERVVQQLVFLKHGKLSKTEALLKYVDDYPQGEYKVAVFDQAAKNAYAAAKQKDTVEAYNRYWDKYKNTRYAKSIRSRFNRALFTAKKRGAIQGGSVATVEQLYLKSMDADLKNKLISLNRAKNTLTGFIAAYKYSKASVDLNAILGIYRAKKTLVGYQNAYKFSGASKDLDSILYYSNSILALEAFLKSYGNKKQAAKAKTKLVALYRDSDTFDGYLKAYKLLSVPSDGKLALSKAKSTVQKGSLEKAAFLKLRNKSYLVRSGMKLAGVSYGDDERTNWGFLSNYEFWGYIRPSVQVSANFIDDLPFQPAFGVYDISMTLSFHVPLNRQLKSKWAGNSDTTETSYAEKSIHFRLKPPYNQKSMKVVFDTEILAYFDRGSAGGYTAKWPSDDAYVTIKNVKVGFSSIQEKSSGKLNINFKEIESLRDTRRYAKVNIDGSSAKGASLINRFSEVDSRRVDRASSYAGSSSASSNSSSVTPSGSRSSSSSSSSSGSSSSGVKEVYNGGYKSSGGYIIYKVKCNSGRSASAFQDGSGWWKDGGGSSYGNKYRNLSKDAFAQRFCN